MMARATALLATLAFAFLLAACGGGSSPAAVADAGPQPAPAASAPAPAASAVPVDPPAAMSWVEAWREPWETLSIGGWVRHGALKCNGMPTDPDQPAEGSFAAGASWALFGNQQGALYVDGGSLFIDSAQSAVGYALIAHRLIDTTRPAALQAVITLAPDPGAWLGLAMIADETDYRELSLYEWDGFIHAGVWHPCKVDWGLGTWAPGPRTLRLEYTPPPADVCWRHFVDGRLVREELCSTPGAPLVGPARPALYVVNLAAEGARVPGLVRATVGPVIVEEAGP